MVNHQNSTWEHDHIFGQDRPVFGERRTLIVIAITAIVMVIEIVAGFRFGSMALLADGIHMGSHAAALSISAFAYFYTRKHAQDRRFSFGTGKINTLGGFTSALLLAIFALMMAWKSIDRFLNPVRILYDQAIFVVVIGLIVNVACTLLLSDNHEKESDRHLHSAAHVHSDHNLRAAYLHVFADAATSLLALFALIIGKFMGYGWMDPFMGVIGAILVSRWSWGLLRDTSKILLDHEAPVEIQKHIVNAIECNDQDKITDLHIWCIGPDIYASSISIVSTTPKSPEYYRGLVPDHIGIVHTTVEVNHY